MICCLVERQVYRGVAMNKKNGKVRANLGQYVHDHIMEMLLRQEIKPGEKVPEERIADLLDVSRTPIREAIRMLAAEGMVNVSPNRVAEVITITGEDVHDLGMIRLNHDILAGKLAIYNGSNADFQRLTDIAEKCDEYGEKKDIYNRIIFDSHFHNELAVIAGNQILIRFQKELYQRTCLYQAIKYSEPEFRDEQMSRHNKILQALLERDEEAYLNATREHLISFYDLENSKYKVFIYE